MKKITWNKVKEKGKKVWEEHRDVCLVTGGVVIGVIGQMIFQKVEKEEHPPQKVDFYYDSSDGIGLKIGCWNIDKMGRKTYATGLTLKPAAAIHMAREILYDLAGEAK